MKKALLFLNFLLLIQYGFSQCTVPANSFGNNQNISSYNITGDVDITLENNNTIRLNLGANFKTASGPDIRAYLVKSKGMSDADLRSAQISTLEHIEFGLVGCTRCVPVIPQNGAKSFTVNISGGDKIEDYDRILFYCLQFNQFWDFGKFTPFNPSNCTLLNIESNTLSENITLYPNPTIDAFEVRNDTQAPLSINIYNILGNQVKSVEKTSLKKQSFSLSNLNSGVYLVEIKSANQSIIKKLIKR
ncbi:T9SS type A sorting domain-containing protein [Flavivirga aquatica]|nr:T9SS type A sorting domain-containing protein [Flavivirga aquatica]